MKTKIALLMSMSIFAGVLSLTPVFAIELPGPSQIAVVQESYIREGGQATDSVYVALTKALSSGDLNVINDAFMTLRAVAARMVYMREGGVASNPVYLELAAAIATGNTAAITVTGDKLLSMIDAARLIKFAAIVQSRYLAEGGHRLDAVYVEAATALASGDNQVTFTAVNTLYAAGNILYATSAQSNYLKAGGLTTDAIYTKVTAAITSPFPASSITSINDAAYGAADELFKRAAVLASNLPTPAIDKKYGYTKSLLSLSIRVPGDQAEGLLIDFINKAGRVCFSSALPPSGFSKWSGSVIFPASRYKKCADVRKVTVTAISFSNMKRSSSLVVTRKGSL
jgi:hypothetical protein